jgi:hypothetical protein
LINSIAGKRKLSNLFWKEWDTDFLFSLKNHYLLHQNVKRIAPSWNYFFQCHLITGGFFLRRGCYLFLTTSFLNEDGKIATVVHRTYSPG